MEYQFFDPSNQAHMELVNMMMQMENLPEFSEVPPPSVIDFSGVSMTPQAFYGTPPSATSPPTIVNPSSTVSLGGQTDGHNSYSVDANIDPSGCGGDNRTSMAAMRETIFRIAAMQPVHIDPEAVKPPKRRNVKISKDPQSVAARHRRERISERIRILQRLVPGGTKMDTASMLDEAIHYVKFLKTQVQSLERVAANRSNGMAELISGANSGTENYWSYDQQQQQQQYMNPTQML